MTRKKDPAERWAEWIVGRNPAGIARYFLMILFFIFALYGFVRYVYTGRVFYALLGTAWLFWGYIDSERLGFVEIIRKMRNQIELGYSDNLRLKKRLPQPGAVMSYFEALILLAFAGGLLLVWFFNANLLLLLGGVSFAFMALAFFERKGFVGLIQKENGMREAESGKRTGHGARGKIGSSETQPRK